MNRMILAIFIAIAIFAGLAVLKLFALLIKLGVFFIGILIIIGVVNALRRKWK